MRLYFVGIGGIGMSGLAEVFQAQGHEVSGSDLNPSETTRRLESKGIQVFQGHQADQVGDAQVVVCSSAVQEDNPEVKEARRRRIPVIPRAEVLGELMRMKKGVAVAGTHGKTTTTSLLAHVMLEGSLDPTVVVGGIVKSLGSNAKLGLSEWVVAEADESDGSFLFLPATYAIITNIDSDHRDHYASLDEIDQAFISFVGKLPFFGLAVVCGDDPGVQRCLLRMTKPTRTYGLDPQCDVVAKDLVMEPLGSRFSVSSMGKDLGSIHLSMPGRHNVLNALSVITLALELGVPFESLQRSLSTFKGVGRRFDVHLETDELTVVDDYAHHPEEIRVVLEAARVYRPESRLVGVFQPHRFTRTRDCFEAFVKVLEGFDEVLLTPVYPAGEAPIAGASSEDLAQRLGKKARVVGSLDEAPQAYKQFQKPGDVVLCMGAGSIKVLAGRLVSGE